MMTDELPPLWALDAAANCIGQNCWADAEAVDVSETLASIIAHARTLQQLAKYERPPVDEAELKRRQDAREFAAKIYTRRGFGDYGARVIAGTTREPDGCVESIYEYACHRDNVTPVPIEEWGK